MRIATTPHDLPGWDTIADSGPFYCSADWLAFSDTDQIAQAAYLGVYGGDDMPRGLLPVHWSPEENNGRYRPPLPDALILGGRRGYLSSPLLAAQADTTALPGLVAAACERFGDCGGRWWWPYLTSDDALNVAAALRVEPGSVSLLGADCVIDVPMGGLERHLAGLSAKQRRTNARREIRAFAESGLRIERSALPRGADILGPLLSQVQRRYGHDHSPGLMTGLLARQAEHLQERSVVFRCLDRHGVTVGFSLAYRHGAELAIRVVGFDYASLDNVGVYAQLGVYEPIRYCAEHGLGRIQLGMESYEAKLRRGAYARPLWSVASEESARQPVSAACAALTASFPEREAAEFAADVRSVAAALAMPMT